MSILRNQLGIPDQTDWNSINDHLIAAGQVIAESEILFAKIEDSVVHEQVEKLKQKEAALSSEKSYEPLKEVSDFGNFAALDLRAGIIESAEKIKKSKKLLKIIVDLGFEKRTILSGIAESFSPEELTGQRVCVVANLAPKKMMGIESNGMILMAENEDGSFKFVETLAEPGSPIT